MVRQQRQHDAGEDQKFAGGHDFPDLDAPCQAVKLLAAGEQKHRGDRHRHGDPRVKRQRDGAEQISEHIEKRHDEADTRLVRLRLMLVDMREVVDEEPSTQHQKPAGERQEMHRVEQIKHSAHQREHRKAADAAGPPLVGVGEIFLEGEAEEEAQAQEQGDVSGRRRRDHAGDYRDRGARCE